MIMKLFLGRTNNRISHGFNQKRTLKTTIQPKNTSKDACKGIYFDFQATTPMDPRVLDAMLPYLTFNYGNPHSRTHEYGWQSEAAVEKAREEIAALIGAHPKEVVFTSGATESNNTALKGVAKFYSEKKNHIITTQIVCFIFKKNIYI